MKVKKVRLIGFRNFKDASVSLNDRTLMIGSNDIGKTNLLYALRLLLDKSLSDRDIEPQITDFHINNDGEQSDSFTIKIYFSEVTEDAVLSILKGHVSDNGTCVISMVADSETLDYQIFIGCSEDELELVQSRFYLKRLNLSLASRSSGVAKETSTCPC